MLRNRNYLNESARRWRMLSQKGSMRNIIAKKLIMIAEQMLKDIPKAFYDKVFHINAYDIGSKGVSIGVFLEGHGQDKRKKPCKITSYFNYEKNKIKALTNIDYFNHSGLISHHSVIDDNTNSDKLSKMLADYIKEVIKEK